MAPAQSATARLSSTVVDEQENILPGATVTLRNPATQQQRQAKSAANGSFTFPQLPPSIYKLTTQLNGFATTEIPSVVLNASAQRALRAQLKVAQVSAMVTVTSDLPLVKETPAVATDSALSCSLRSFDVTGGKRQDITQPLWQQHKILLGGAYVNGEFDKLESWRESTLYNTALSLARTTGSLCSGFEACLTSKLTGNSSF